MRFRLASLSTLGSKHLRVSNKLKCSQTIARPRYSLVVDEDVKKPTNQTNKSQTIAVDKTATGSLRLPYSMPESTKGHMEKKNDSIHVTLGSATRRIELYKPEQWFAAVRGAGTSKQRYRVKEMLAEDLHNFKTMFSSAKNLLTGDNREKIM